MSGYIYEGLTTNLHKDQANKTMDKKLVITVAPTGTFTTREQNPYQPYTPAEIARHVIESYKEGTTVWHVHCRNEDGTASKDPEMIRRTIDLVLDKCPDIITSCNVIADYSQQGVGLIRPIVEELTKAGPEYIRTAVVTPYTMTASERVTVIMTEKILQDVNAYLRDKGVKSEFQGHNYTAIRHVCDWLIEPGLLEKPYLMNLILGYHAFHHTSPVQPDPWGHLYMMSMLQTMPAGSVVGVTVGGHNWLPLTVEAIMLGVDCIRVGMEDTIWMYPHKDDKIRNCAEVVRKVATIAKELGREIASPAEAKQILGL